MALDPTAPTTGWGLGALGAPSQSTMPLAPTPTLTPGQVALMRQHAMALQEPPQGGIHHWTQGLAELVRAIQGNREADFARQAEATGRGQGAAAISSIYAPYLSSSGASPPAAGAAPAGTSGSASAGAMVSSADDQDADTSGSTTTADASTPRGIRNNNPLNIEDGQFARSQPGYAGSDGRFAKFQAPEHGVSAANTLLDSYQTNHGLNTVSGIVNRWAPSSDGNDTNAYATHVASQMGIGPNDPVTPEMRPQLIAAMAQHENGRPLNQPNAAPMQMAAKKPNPADDLRRALQSPVPIQKPTTPDESLEEMMKLLRQGGATDPSQTRLAYAGGDLPPGLPNVITQGAQMRPTPPSAPQPSVFDTGAPPVPNLSPMVSAIAGRAMPAGIAPPGGVPWNPDDFKRQVAAMEAAKGPATSDGGIAPPNGQWTPETFKAAVAAMEAAKQGGGTPQMPSGGGLPPGSEGMTAPASLSPPVAPIPPPFLPPGSSIPGAIGPTSVGGAPLNPAPGAMLPPPVGPTSVNGQQLPTSGGGGVAPLVSAIAGRPIAPPVAVPGTGGGAAIPEAPIRVAQNGAPTSLAPTAPVMPPVGGAGLPQPLTSPTGQITPDQLTRTLANPWVPDSAKAAMLQMIQQRGQPQTMPVEGGTMMFNAAGQKVFIPEPKFGTVKIGSAEIPTVSHFDPASGRWNTTTLAPGGGVQTGAPSSAAGAPLPHPAMAQGAEPDLSTIGGIQANEAAQAGAKKAAEAGGEATAKYYDSLHKGLAGSAMIAAQQKQNIDLLRQVAASPNFTPGAGSEAALGLQRIAATLGINTEGAAPRELFNQVATRILADQISGIKSMASETGETGGRIFKSMLDLEEKANITPEDTAAGINAKINLIDHAGDLMMKWGDMADDYVKDHGKLDAGFDKTLRKEISSARIPNAVPKSAEPAPARSDIEAEMRRRGLLNANPAVAPVSQ